MIIYDSPSDRLDVIRAAGGVLWRSASSGIEVALVHRPRYDDWSLPKGKLAAGEHPLLGAYREVTEETGVRPVVGRRLPDQRYTTRRGPKVVSYWVMHGSAGSVAAAGEVGRMAWLPLELARERLSYPGDAEMLDLLGEHPDGRAMLVVRHGRAGDPDDWSAEDDLRPLDPTGRRQAHALARVLPIFGVSRVLSARPVRCVDTVAPLATNIGVDVELEPTVGEQEYAAHPDTGLRRIRALADDGATAAVCSQGEVIPDLVARLARENGVPMPEPRSKKGSAWALFFTNRRLTAADYYPTLS